MPRGLSLLKEPVAAGQVRSHGWRQAPCGSKYRAIMRLYVGLFDDANEPERLVCYGLRAKIGLRILFADGLHAGSIWVPP